MGILDRFVEAEAIKEKELALANNVKILSAKIRKNWNSAAKRNPLETPATFDIPEHLL